MTGVQVRCVGEFTVEFFFNFSQTLFAILEYENDRKCLSESSERYTEYL